MHYTLSCITKSGIKRNSTVGCFSPAANTSTIGCVVSVRKRTSIRLIEINLVGAVENTLKCETRCFGFYDQTAICYPPKSSHHSDIKAYYNVAARSSLHKISLFVGSTPVTDKTASYDSISEDDSLSCYVYLSDTAESDRLCCYNVLQKSQINHYVLDIGYTQAALLRCVTKGEAYTEMKCCLTTHMKVSTRDALIHRAVNPDNFSEVKGICYRVAGSIAQVQPLQVIGGYRYINDLSCIMKTPTPSIYDLLCCNPGAIDSSPAYTTTRSGKRLLLNIYNIGSREVLGADIKQKGLSLPANTISFRDNLWVVSFDLSVVSLNNDYFITLRLKGIEKMIILSAIKGKLNLG